MLLNKLKKYMLKSIILVLPMTCFAKSIESSTQTNNIISIESSPQTKKNKSIESVPAKHDYEINPLYSKINFEVDHLVVSSVIGEFKEFEGKFKFNPKDFSQTELIASAKASSIDTGFNPRNEHLKSADFFDAIKFPLLTFKSTSAKKTGKNTLDLTGNMTIKDVTKPVTFKIIYKGEFKTKDDIKQSFKATAKINRKDFGMNFQMLFEATPAIGDIITISITSEGIHKLSDSTKI
ncbi:YceI family protein [Fluviispira vulneris]|uniref:YceI family protein n=1 Tax=Fluviispira vulneris TaxID=2763012 RepID=UPI001644123C|nr:YceI family protein [Fluviispira vulneris]